MRTLLLAALASFAVLANLPVAFAQEEETVSAPAFPTGKTFTLRVASVNTAKWKDNAFWSTTGRVPIPAGIPKYKVGQKITFTIGRDGRLTWPNQIMPFLNQFDGYVLYGRLLAPGNPFFDNATIDIDSRNRPIRGKMNFYHIKKSGVVHMVVYELW